MHTEFLLDGNYNAYGSILGFKWSGKHKTRIDDLRFYFDYKRSSFWIQIGNQTLGSKIYTYAINKSDEVKIMIKLRKKGQEISTDDERPWLYFDTLTSLR